MIPDRVCTTCGIAKPREGFYIKRKRLTAQCKVCLIEKTVQWAKANPDKRTKTTRKWLSRNRDLHNRQCRASYRKNPEACKTYADQHRDSIRRNGRAWAKRNLPYLNAMWHKRRARIAGNGGEHTKEDIERLFQEQNGICASRICSTYLHKFHIDHINPIIRGGSNSPDNLQLLCPPCNQRKNTKTPEQWAHETRAGIIWISW